MRLLRRTFKTRASGEIEREEPVLTLRVMRWNSQMSVHDINLTLRIPLSQAKELKAELDGLILTAEAKLSA